MMNPEIHGSFDAKFSKVRDAFAANFASPGEVGASFAATVDGKLVVDLWAGYADAAQTRLWQRDTIVNVFSTTKAMTALSAHMLVDRGLLDVDAPVARYWPEFAQAKKVRLPVRYLLSHQAGLAAIAEPLPSEAFFDWQRMVAALAAQKPWWEPGTRHGYHALTYGYLVGEVVRRITGKRLGVFFRDEVATPLGADFHIGLPERHEPRVGEIVAPPPQKGGTAAGFAALPPDSLVAKVMTNPPYSPGLANTRAWRAAEIPAANGHGNARAAARVMAALACGGELDGVRLLERSTIEKAIVEQASGVDLVLGAPRCYALGFMLLARDDPRRRSSTSFGHGGHGGSFALADLQGKLSWAYVMNRMSAGSNLEDIRAARIAEAFYTAL